MRPKNSLSRSKQVWAGKLFSERRMLPRWRSPAQAASSGERHGNYERKEQYAPSADRWVRVLTQAHEQGEAYASRDLAESSFILSTSGPSHWNESTVSLQQLWDRAIARQHLFEAGPPLLLNESPQDQARAAISRLKKVLSDSPNQALIWSELSRHYVILGKDDQAQTAMACAIHAAKGHSYVTRVAARLYAHVEQPDQALQLIRRSPHHRVDPRIFATEISLAKGEMLRGNWVAAARGIISDARYHPSFVSELMASLATVEMTNGKHKVARQLFNTSLRNPTENTLAQAQWATERDSRIVIPDEAWNTPGSDEARALAARVRHNWDDVLGAAECWLAAEPFSASPAAMASFATFTPEQLWRSEAIATRGLAANPSDALLLNNRAVSRAYQGNAEGSLSDVRRALETALPEDRNDPVLFATLGLVAYRSGDATTGRGCYAHAIRMLLKEKQPRAAALGSLFWLREEYRVAPGAETDQVHEAVKKAIPKITQGDSSPEIVSMLEAIEREKGVAGSSAIDASRNESCRSRIISLADKFIPDRDDGASPTAPLTTRH